MWDIVGPCPWMFKLSGYLGVGSDMVFSHFVVVILSRDFKSDWQMTTGNSGATLHSVLASSVPQLAVTLFHLLLLQDFCGTRVAYYCNFKALPYANCSISDSRCPDSIVCINIQVQKFAVY